MASNLPQREFPQNIEVEQSVLGSILLDNEAFGTTEGILEAEHFYREGHRKIFRAMTRLAQADEPIDLVTLTEELRSSGALEEVGGTAYLIGLADGVPTAAYAENYARIVLEKATLRRLGDLGGRIQLLANEEDSFEEVREEIHEILHTELRRGDRLRITNDWATSKPPDRAWLCPGWLPLGRVALLTGPGEIGKSLLSLQLATTVASGASPDGAERTDALPIMAGTGEEGPAVNSDHTGPVVMVGYEDEADEVARRLRMLPCGTSGSRLPKELHYVDLAGRGPIWAPREGKHRDTGLTLTKVGAQIERYLEEVQPKLLVLDPVAAAYAGNENDRAAVRSFLSYLNDLAAGLEAATLLIAHPPKSEDRYSGSTDWLNGVRALWTLGAESVPGWERAEGNHAKDKAAKGYALELAKSNYSRSGKQAWLRFRADSKPDGGAKTLAWEEVSPGEAAKAYHRFKGWPAPVSKGVSSLEGPPA